jgi:hypothetical protein
MSIVGFTIDWEEGGGLFDLVENVSKISKFSSKTPN